MDPWPFTIILYKWVHCNPIQGQYRARTGFSLCTFPTQGKTCFHYRVPRWWKQVFPCEKKYTGKTLFSLQGRVCSASLSNLYITKIAFSVDTQQLRNWNYIFFSITEPCSRMKPPFLIMSGYYIVPSPSTPLKATIMSPRKCRQRWMLIT